jgi:hypothetical protein
MHFSKLTLISIAALLLHFRFYQPDILTHNMITRSSFFDSLKNNKCNYPVQNSFNKCFKPGAIDLLLEFCFYHNEYLFFDTIFKNLISSKLKVNLNCIWNIYEHIKDPCTYIRQKDTEQWIIVNSLPDNRTVHLFKNMLSGPELDFIISKRYIVRREEDILSPELAYDNRNNPTNIENIKSGQPRNNFAGLNRLASIKDQTGDISKKSSNIMRNYQHKWKTKSSSPVFLSADFTKKKLVFPRCK